jgi:hypothetical protein
VAWAGLFACATAGVAYLLAWVSHWTDALSTFAAFGGWQVDVVGWSLTAAVVTAAAVAAVTVVRLRRRAGGPSPRRRAAALVAFVPGLVVGGLVATSMQTAVSWASSHTSSAAAAHRDLLLSLGMDSSHPPVIHGWGTAVSPALAARFLHPADLGAGWYDVHLPDPTTVPVVAALRSLGEVSGAGATLTQQRWTGKAWTLDSLLTETAQAFSTRAQAARVARLQAARPTDTCSCHVVAISPTTQRTVMGVTVWQRSSRSSQAGRWFAAFAIGSNVYTVSVGAPAPKLVGAKRFAEVVHRAVDRALNGR